MKNRLGILLLAALALFNAGCVALVIGGAAGALGAYAVSRDTLEGETDKSYDSLWQSAVKVAKEYGVIKREDTAQGYIEVESGSGYIWIRLVRMTRHTTRLRIAARKYKLPDASLAEEIFVKVMNGAG